MRFLLKWGMNYYYGRAIAHVLNMYSITKYHSMANFLFIRRKNNFDLRGYLLVLICFDTMKKL